MNSLSLVNRIATVRTRIDAARLRAGRTHDITLVAVTKSYPAALIHQARDAGLVDVGENRVAEMQGKVDEVGRDVVRWHLIGHLQRNKARRAIPLFDLLHSLDSVRLARQLSDDAASLGTEVRALVQVNTSGEESKFGFDPEHALDAIGEMAEMPRLRLVGLMTMAPYTGDEAVLRRTFRGARLLWEEAARQVPSFEAVELSMGMSNDFEIAVEEGSTLVRLGTVLFGEREL